MSQDSRGYYKLLGVGPNATPSEIKAAYRAKAMELHPDRNQSKNTTQEFQDLQQAYDVLSDEKEREQYDADNAMPEDSSDDDTFKPFEPIKCSVCSAVSAQPRYKVFHYVISYFFGSTKTPIQGVFCSKCEIKAGVKATGITLALGWWSLPGFVWTLVVLFENLTGGVYNKQTARLQGYQAMYFARQGKVDIAKAIALESKKLVERELKRIRVRRGKSFRAHKEDLEALKNHLEGFLEQIGSTVSTVELKNTDKLFNKRFLYQALMISCFGLCTVSYIKYENQLAIEKESARLEKIGIEQEKARAIAAQEAATLKALEKPLPKDGIYFIANKSAFNPRNCAPFKITNSPDANSLLKIVRKNDGSTVMSIFIRAGATVEVPVPLGIYRIKLASGSTWYGDSVRFGPHTSYAQLDNDFIFAIEGDQYAGHEIRLQKISHGNLKEAPLTAEDF